MTSSYTLTAAQQMLPEARRRISEAAVALGELRLLVERRDAEEAPPEVTAGAADKERELEESLRWFADRGIQVKGIEPALLDWPSVAVKDGQTYDVLLCWREDEEAIAFYHPPEVGYRGREPVAMLDQV